RPFRWGLSLESGREKTTPPGVEKATTPAGETARRHPPRRQLTQRRFAASMAIMDFDDASPRARPDSLIAQLIREDLDGLSVAELEERITLLTGEIERTRAKKESAVTHKASAEALFRK